MNHNEKTIRRFSYIPEGGSLADTKDIMPEELRTKKIFSSRGSSKRLEGNKCCPTLVPGHSAFPVHPKENRSITIREGATLTGFPINYKFFGSHTSRCEQIGNAIPVNIAYNLAISISNYLKKNLEVDKKVENRELCQFILTRGKNKGNLCNKKNCKKHKIEEKIEEI